ncbi:HlyD family type I secretion periplasmic adaptor subunit [Prodigiosinella confusarubida]|uniref:Membrane fusion protein (MFP) family protein n=1 Tax=Serratia sp. (strain ATCC 39006) TaxID=104623 RepID=A0A2I5T5U8_SERS3|nr:HlyD family type I secretion periplasmic adaptor subunit [Serratia sp. ATCC 39006]AUG99911.1 HlyD family type I secretion periplasmic adaptor subunit [Serratia sp. ATCC 39006]AUH04231.1 HlyD family type I secretion periplasmic adaptor subunit [Serratia sp. ATCC 39006]
MHLVKNAKRLLAYFFAHNEEEEQIMPEVSRAMIEDAPRIIRLSLWAILAFFIFFFLWAALANIDEVTRGEGKAVPSSRLQKIQNLEGGIVSKMFIHEGQIVSKGEPLLQLDATRFASNVGETEADRLTLVARIARLNAEINNKELNLPKDVIQDAPEVARGEQNLYNSRRKQFHNEISGLKEQQIQRQQELRDFIAKQEQFRNSLKLLQQEIKMSEPLIAEGAISKVEVLRLRRSEVETLGQLNSVTLSIPRAEAAFKEVNNKIEEAQGRYISDALSQLNEAQTNLNKITATGKALEDRVNRTLVVSPVKGIVQQILVNTIGGVIQPGSDLVEIVPLDDKLLIEARIRPRDIAFLHPGQNAVIKFTAYDYTIYGGLKGHLEQISPDTVTDKDGNSFYIIRLRTDKNYLGTAKKPLLIIPGMVATVDIMTGKKTILSYLLKPILRARAEALRER